MNIKNNLTTVLSVHVRVCVKGLICGETLFNPNVLNERVIGGHNAKPNTWKWQVKPTSITFFSYWANLFNIELLVLTVLNDFWNNIKSISVCICVSLSSLRPLSSMIHTMTVHSTTSVEAVSLIVSTLWPQLTVSSGWVSHCWYLWTCNWIHQIVRHKSCQRCSVDIWVFVCWINYCKQFVFFMFLSAWMLERTVW